MDPNNGTDFIIKIEPVEENLKIENVSLDILKLSVNMVYEGTELKLKLELENPANTHLIDHAYCKVLDTVLYNRKDTDCDNSAYSVSSVTEQQKEISQMDPDNASNFILKTEPGLENVKIEDVLLDIGKLNVNMVHEGTELKPKLELETQAIENLMDHTYCKIPDTLLYKYEGLFPSQIEPPVKTEQFEHRNESEQTYDVNFENWDIKNELDIKEDDFKPEENSMSPERVAPDEYFVSITDLKYSQNDHEKTQESNSETPERRTEHVNIYPFKCDQCNYQTARMNCLRKHLLCHTDPAEGSLLKRDQCENDALNKTRLKSHQLQHKNPKETNTLKCCQCNYKTFRYSTLQMHLLSHAPAKKGKTFKCDQCSFRTTYHSHIKRHHTYQHESSDNFGKFQCNKCLFQTRYKWSLQNHLLLHANPEEVERFECYHCKYKTIHKRVLKKHLLRHKRLEKIVSFACDQCGHQTTRPVPKKDQMLRCERCHVNRETPSNVDIPRLPVVVDKLKCDFCDYETVRKGALTKHVMQHPGATMFECRQCRYKAVGKNTLQKHILKHIQCNKVMFKLDQQ